MPRMIAPQPSEEFHVKLSKPFSGAPSHTVEITGKPNSSATIKLANHHGASIQEKSGEMPADDVKELMDLLQQVRGFPSSESEDVYGLDTKLELATFEIQWASNEDDQAGVSEVGDETKSTFKDVVDSIEAAARQFAKQDSAI